MRKKEEEPKWKILGMRKEMFKKKICIPNNKSYFYEQACYEYKFYHKFVKDRETTTKSQKKKEKYWMKK